MRIVSADEIARVLDYRTLADAIADMFRAGCEMPVRHHHTIGTGPGANATLLLMPAWQEERYIGVKIVTVFPDNGAKGLPAVMGSYILIDGNTGTQIALFDGPELTARRTAAASALAAGYLAREDSRALLMVGTGAMAPHLIEAHAAVRPITEVKIWGRTRDKAAALAARLDESRLSVQHAPDLQTAVSGADIISCATLSTAPLILGDWLRAGQHLDLVGAFRPNMRETDDQAVRRSRIFVDTRDGALKEGGDLVQALDRGVISRNDIEGDLFQLTRGETVGRQGRDDITLFKSTGAALEDLAAANLAYRRIEGV